MVAELSEMTILCGFLDAPLFILKNVEYLLHNRHNSRFRDSSSEQNKVPVLMEMTLYVGKTDEKEINILSGGDKCNGEK